jgi:hypothetical protein
MVFFPLGAEFQCIAVSRSGEPRVEERQISYWIVLCLDESLSVFRARTRRTGWGICVLISLEIDTEEEGIADASCGRIAWICLQVE